MQYKCLRKIFHLPHHKTTYLWDFIYDSKFSLHKASFTV